MVLTIDLCTYVGVQRSMHLPIQWILTPRIWKAITQQDYLYLSGNIHPPRPPRILIFPFQGWYSQLRIHLITQISIELISILLDDPSQLGLFEGPTSIDVEQFDVPRHLQAVGVGFRPARGVVTHQPRGEPNVVRAVSGTWDSDVNEC